MFYQWHLRIGLQFWVMFALAGFGNFFWTSCQQTITLLNVNKLDINCQLASFLKACSLCRLNKKPEAHWKKNSTRFWSCIKHIYPLGLGWRMLYLKDSSLLLHSTQNQNKDLQISFTILSRSPDRFWKYKTTVKRDVYWVEKYKTEILQKYQYWYWFMLEEQWV